MLFLVEYGFVEVFWLIEGICDCGLLALTTGDRIGDL